MSESESSKPEYPSTEASQQEVAEGQERRASELTAMLQDVRRGYKQLCATDPNASLAPLYVVVAEAYAAAGVHSSEPVKPKPEDSELFQGVLRSHILLFARTGGTITPGDFSALGGGTAFIDEIRVCVESQGIIHPDDYWPTTLEELYKLFQPEWIDEEDQPPLPFVDSKDGENIKEYYRLLDGMRETIPRSYFKRDAEQAERADDVSAN